MSSHLRIDLARAKLYSEMTAQTERHEYSGILMRDTGDGRGADYIEVHIYGTFNRNAISRIGTSGISSREDRLLWRSLIKKAEAAGIVTESVQ